MKCPKCDTDTSGKRKCSKYGLDVAGSQEEIEVKYKDFKTSELLEIRHKKQTAHDNEEIKTSGQRKVEKALKLGCSREGSCQEGEKPFPFLAAMALILILIAGAFFIFRYLIIR